MKGNKRIKINLSPIFKDHIFTSIIFRYLIKFTYLETKRTIFLFATYCRMEEVENNFFDMNLETNIILKLHVTCLWYQHEKEDKEWKYFSLVSLKSIYTKQRTKLQTLVFYSARKKFVLEYLPNLFQSVRYEKKISN